MSWQASRRKYVRRWYRQTPKRIDRTGMISGRLVYLEWLGKWRGRDWWKALCECGRTVEVRWRPGNTTSCGCYNLENARAHGWESQRPDGKWGLPNPERLFVVGDRRLTAKQMAEIVGISKHRILDRTRKWPPERWLEPARYVGRKAKERKQLIRQKTRERQTARPQPWSRTNVLKAQEANARRSGKDQ